MKVSLFYNPNKLSQTLIDEIKEAIIGKGFIIDDENPELIFYVGGDGTFLRAAQRYLDKLDSLLFVGIGCGHLGFLYDYRRDELDVLLDDLLNKRLNPREYPLIKAELVQNDKIDEIFALNEIRIENPFHTLVCDVHINDEQLETFQGNGLVVSSSIGSTAYNRSLGGAIIEQNLSLLELTEIATIQSNLAHSLNSSLILNGNTKITFDASFEKVVIGYDHLNLQNSGIKKIVISLSDKKIRVLKNKDRTYISHLKECFVK